MYRLETLYRILPLGARKSQRSCRFGVFGVRVGGPVPVPVLVQQEQGVELVPGVVRGLVRQEAVEESLQSQAPDRQPLAARPRPRTPDP